MPDRVVTGRRIVTDGKIIPASIHIVGGTIAAIGGPNDYPLAAEVIDAGEHLVLPGLVDSHVHINEPGRSEWEGFSTATQAAAAGGITTVVDMPLNSIPPTTTVAGLKAKQAAARGQVYVDVAFWGGLVAENQAELEGLIDAGVCGFKCFLIESGVPEFSHVTAAELLPALEIAGAGKRPVLAHAELAGPIQVAAEAAAQVTQSSSKMAYLTYLRSRPNAAEDEAIALMVGLATQTRAPVHIVHHASASSLAMLEAAKNEGVSISAETCPHYLHFAAEEIPNGATQFKCAPPIRERENRGRLWDGLTADIVDMVVSDHSPCVPSLKHLEDGDFMEAWGGVASLGLALPVMWTELSSHGYTPTDIARWLAERPAKLAGLTRKGRIRVGGDADLVIFDGSVSSTLDPSDLRFRNRVCPYLGESLQGRVERTILGGQTIFVREPTGCGRIIGGPRGRLLSR